MGLIYGRSHKWNIKVDYPYIQAMSSHSAVLMEAEERTSVSEVSLLLSATLILLRLYMVQHLILLEKNLANPTALLLSGVSMLRHLNLHNKATKIQNAILNTIA